MQKNFRTYHLALTAYREVKTLRLEQHLRMQLLRACSSICLNLAEGSGKRTAKEKRNFYHIAMGSLRECQAILEISQNEKTKSYSSLDLVGAGLFRLLEYYEEKE